MLTRKLGRLLLVALLALVCVVAAPSAQDFDWLAVIDGEFETQPYVLPNGQGYRHMTAVVDEDMDELILFGGLGNGGPAPPTPMNHKVYTLDLEEASSAQAWEERSTDAVVPKPWFTSTRGFIQIDDRYYLACDDSDVNAVYAFDPDTYAFELVSQSTLGPELDAGDCCAVGVNIRNSRGDNRKEERIYFLGGRNDFATPAPYVRYYSLTYDRWERAADLKVGRSHLGCAPVEKQGEPLIYAIGGGDQTQGEALRSIEIYDVGDDEWTLYDDYLPEGGGRTRVGVQNVDDEYLLLIGGDSSCAGGGATNLCAPDQPLTTVDVIDIRHGNELLSSEDHLIPQLKTPRQTPATSLSRRRGLGWGDQYVLHVIGGRTRGPSGLGVLTTTEVLSFDRIQVHGLRWTQ